MFVVWEKNNRAGLLLSFLSAAALVANSTWLTCISSWLAFGTVVWASCVTAPGFRFDIHWRSLLLFTFIIILSLICLVEKSRGENELLSNSFRLGFGVVNLFVCVVTAIIYNYFPVSSNPELSGKYHSVGTTSFNLPFSSPIVPANMSSITIQCWFPINHSPTPFELCTLLWTSGHPDYQLQEILDLLTALTKSNSLPSFCTHHLTLARTKTFWQAAFDKLIGKDVQAKFPIAIYSHGMYGWRQIHHTACEKLASEGFIVFACDHIPDCLLTRPLGGTPSYFDFVTPKGIEPLMERAFFQKGLEMRVVQLTTLINHIMSDSFVQAYPHLAGRLDFDHINLWGHSFGGLTISAVCCRGAEMPFKINSAVVLDGWLYPLPEDDRQKGFHKTSMLNISADLWTFGKVCNCSIYSLDSCFVHKRPHFLSRCCTYSFSFKFLSATIW